MALDRRLYVQDTWNGGTWYDLSSWADSLSDTEAPRGEGNVQEYKVDVLSARASDGAAIPVQIIGGMELVRFDKDYYGTNSHRYLFGGRVINIERDPTPEGYTTHVQCEGFERDLNAVIGFISFVYPAQRYDKDRIQALVESSGVLTGTWDGHTYVEGPFIDYLNQPAAGFYRTSIWNIIKALAVDPAAGTTRTYRRWYVTGEWSNPASIGTGRLTRMLHYYEGLTGPQETLPLTDRVDRAALIFQDSFNRADSAITLGQADTGQVWQVLSGIWGISSNRAYLAVASAGSDYTAVLDGGTADGDLQVTFSVIQTPNRLAFRVTSLPATGYKWEGFIVQAVAATNYTVWRYQGGSFTNLATISVVPANGDVVKVNMSGTTFKVYINGTLRSTLTGQTFNQTATLHGIGIQSIGTGRFDAFSFNGLGNQYYGWQQALDYTGLMNTIAISGPGGDPVAPDWQNSVNASTSQGRVVKTDVSAWSPSHAYLIGDRVTPLANPNGKHYRANNNGTSSATEPGTWPTTEGATVVDGGVTWVCETWDSGAISKNVFTEDGGYTTTVIEQNTLVTDSFDRPDGSLGKADSGQTWSIINGTWIVSNGNAAMTTPGLAVIDAGVGSSAIVQCTAVNPSNGWRLAFRVKDANNAHWLLFKGAGAGCDIIRWQAGAATVIGHIANDLANGTVVKIVLADTSISVYLNGVFIVTYTGQTFLQGATQHGISAATGTATTAQWSDFTVWTTYANKIWGLTFSATCKTTADIYCGIYFDGPNRTAQAMELGVLKGSAQTGTLNDRFKIEARRELLASGAAGLVVKYYRQAGGTGDYTLFYTSTTNPSATSATPLYVGAAIYHTGGAVTSVVVRRFTYAVYSDTVSVAAYGPMWAKDVLHSDDLDSPDKRQTVANGLFARYGYPRNTVTLISLRQYTAGRRVLVNNSRLGLVNDLRIISKVETRVTGSLTKEYKLTIGDTPYEYGDDEPLGYLIRVPDRDTAAPGDVTNFAVGAGIRQGLLVGQQFTWGQPGGDVEWTELTVYRPNGTPGPSDVHLFPAVTGSATVDGLLPATLYWVRARFIDYNNNGGTPTPAIEFTSMSLPRPPAPTWAGTPIGTTGVDQAGKGFADLYWINPAPAYDPAAIVIMAAQATVDMAPVVVTGNPLPANFRLTGLAVGTPYSITLATRDSFGIQGPSSTAQTVTIVPKVTKGPYNGDFEILNPSTDTQPDGWSLIDSTGAGWSMALDTTVQRTGKRSLKFTTVNSGREILQSIDFNVDPNTVYVGSYSIKVSSLTPVFNINTSIRYYDASGTDIGGSGTVNYTPSTLNWETAINYASDTPLPAGATTARLILDIGRGGGGAFNMWLDNVSLIPQTNNTLLGSGAIDTPTKFGSGMAAVQKASSMPGSPAANDTVFRYDAGRLVYWDGSRWLNVAPQLVNYVLTSGNVTPFPNTLAANTGVYVASKHQQYAWWHERADFGWYVNTTNSASHYWTIALVAVSSSGARTILGSFNTSAAAPNTYNTTSLTSFAANPTAATGAVWLQVELTKTGTPGSIYLYPQHTIREVLT